MRLIDADELIKGFDMCIDAADDTASVLIASTFKRIVNNQPTIEPKRGRWIQRPYDGIYCSECGKGWSFMLGAPSDVENYHYCPSCGKRMEEGEADG